MRARSVVIAASASVAIMAIGAVAAWPRGATPVTEHEALADFRSRAPTSDRSGTDPATPSSVPAAGVYTYASSGEEVVKLGVLPAEARPYPATMTVVVVGDDASCFTTTVNLIDQHTEDTTYCVDEARRLRIETHRKQQQIGALRPTAVMTCDPGVLVAPGVDESELACTLSLAGGPAQLTATLNGVARTASRSPVTVGERAVDAVAVDVDYEISGDLTGRWHERLWFASDDWLLVRIERDLDLRGLATFTERSTLELTDRSPRR